MITKKKQNAKFRAQLRYIKTTLLSLMIFLLLLPVSISGCGGSKLQMATTEAKDASTLSTTTISTTSSSTQTSSPQLDPTPQPKITPNPIPEVIQKAICIEANTGDSLSFEDDTYNFNVNGSTYVLNKFGDISADRDGKVIRNRIGQDYPLFITNFYYINYKDDLIFLYMYENGDMGTSDICLIDTETLATVWYANLPAFKLNLILSECNFIYITGIGYIGKLDLSTTNFVWQKEGAFDGFDIGYAADAQIAGDKLILRAETTSQSNNVTAIEFDKNTGEYTTVVNSKKNTSQREIYPYVDLSFKLLGQSYDQVKKDVDNWVYGKGKMVEVDKDEFIVVGNMSKLLDFQFEDDDKFILISGLSDSYVVRDGIVIAGFNNPVTASNKMQTIYDIFNDLISIEPYTEKLGEFPKGDDPSFKAKNGLPQHLFYPMTTVINIYHYSLNNAHLRIVGQSYAGQTAGQAFFKDYISFYLYTLE